MKKRVVISTFYEGYAVKSAITKLSPDKLILLIDDSQKGSQNEKSRKALEELKKFCARVLEIQEAKIKAYDIPKIIEKCSELIKEENKEGNEIIVHITEGRKITSLGLLFAAYLKKEKVAAAYYITQEENKLITLPLIPMQLGESKKLILQEINKGARGVNKLQSRLKIKSVIYDHIRELRNEGYIENNKNNKELKLTDLGRIMIL